MNWSRVTVRLGRAAIAAATLLVAQWSFATDHYVATTGLDTNPGTYSQPWKTLAYSVNQMHAGETLYVRGGTYREYDFHMTASGIAGSPITIKNYGTEKPILDAAHPDFQTINNGAWTEVDSTRHIYKSTTTYAYNDYHAFIGGTIEAGGHTWRLIGYSDRLDTTGTTVHGYDYMASDNHNYDMFHARYMGPGVCYGGPSGTDNYIYIRLTPPLATALDLTTTPYPSWYTDLTSTFNVSTPTTLDPRKYKINLSNDYVGFYPDGHDVVWDGIDIYDTIYTIRTALGYNLTFKNFTLRPGQYGMLLGGQHDTVVDNVVFDMMIPEWVAWADVKFGEIPADWMRTCCLATDGAYYNLEVKNSQFNHTFDGVLAIAAPANPLHDLHFHNIVGNDVRDDFVQLGTSSYNIEINNNTIHGAGPSHHSTGDQPTGFGGTKWIHHNVIDTSKLILWNRNDPNHLRTADQEHWMSPNCFSTHDDGCASGDPWKLYYNTVVVGNRMFVGEMGTYLFSSGIGATFFNNSTGSKHEAYNNIYCEVYNNSWYPDARTYMARAWVVDKPWEVFDGNLYHSAPGGLNSWWWEVWLSTPAAHYYNNLAGFKASSDFTATTTYYTPGWEANGVDADPQLTNIAAGDYRPQAAAAKTGAVDISAKGWPGCAPYAAYRGAVAPDAAPTGPLDTLAGYWRLNEGTGTAAADYTTGAHTATLNNGPTWATGKIGSYALSFDGVNDYLSVPNHADFNMGSSTSFTVSAWVKAASGNGGIILKKGSWDSGKKVYSLYIYNGKLNVYLNDAVVGGYIVTGNATITDNNWHFVAVTFDRTGYVNLYIDTGASYDSRGYMAAIGNLDDTAESLHIGGGYPGFYFNGQIDEPRVYRRLLTSTEISTLAAEH